MSLAPPANSGGTVTDWVMNWHQPCAGGSSGCSYGGHIWHVYMESVNGGSPTFWTGHSSSVCCAFTTYPGLHQLPTPPGSQSGVCPTSTSSNCSIPGRPGRIIIDVPRSLVGSPPDNGMLFSATAATLTLHASGNSNNAGCGPPENAATTTCGVLFNVIDVNNPFDATVAPRPSPSVQAVQP